MLADDDDDGPLLPIYKRKCCSFCSGGNNQHRRRSPYLASSIWFALSSIVYAVAAIQVCLKSGFTSENVQSLVAASLYVVAYLSYVRAEWRPIDDNKTDAIAATLGSPGALQRY